MLNRTFSLFIFSGLLLYCSLCSADIGIYNKGKVKLRGNIIEGACVVTVNNRASDDIIVDMGSYRSDQLKEVGFYPDKEYVTFRIYVGQCNIDSKRNIEIVFNGETASEDSTLFRVYTDKTPSALKEERGNKEVGLGLALFDQEYNALVPNSVLSSSKFRGRDGLLTFLAKYKVIKNEVRPGELFSEVNFKVFYP